ncbi:protein of unknown function [Geodermatophilus telluris]|uniref:DUF4407 domain-containing protein n=1 Tax=Geodermatophilus telluris TaxID=1190417 RepID=A0A1G6PB86_9ACTN|nr:DUF4407 domain-containing protein [Geodermatophilus telluris]SDC77329.1 protein of unknown function [Geodermatophilus telluris]
MSSRKSAARRLVSRAVVTEQLLTVAGANREVLREAPKERGKQVAMGAVLLSTAGLAVVSASYALHLALHLWWPVAIAGGLVWGLVILNLDRWLVVSSPRLRSKAGTLAMATPRVLLAVLIGAVVSTPLTLAVFSAEIDTEVRVMAAEEEDAFTRQLAEDSRYAQLPALREQIAALEADIADGVTPADVNADPAVLALQEELADTRARFEEAEQAYQAERDGTGGSGVRGDGPETEAKRIVRDRLEREVIELAQRLEDLKVEVREQLEAEEVQKTADQRTELDRLEALVAGTQEARDAEVAAHEEAVGTSDGILARLTALGRLGEDNPTLATAHWLLFAFMTAIECLPIIFKTMLALSPPSLYERLLALEEEKVEERVRLRMQAEYEEAEVLARSALAAAEARAARTLEAESRATGMVLDAQLDVTRHGVQRWRDEQLAGAVRVNGTDLVKRS